VKSKISSIFVSQNNDKMKHEFVPYEQALELKEIRFNEPCFGYYQGGTNNLIIEQIIKSQGDGNWCLSPTFSQAINFLYIYSNKQIDIELKASDTYEERVRKINQGCEDLRNLQNNKSN